MDYAGSTDALNKVVELPLLNRCTSRLVNIHIETHKHHDGGFYSTAEHLVCSLSFSTFCGRTSSGQAMGVRLVFVKLWGL